MCKGTEYVSICRDVDSSDYIGFLWPWGHVVRRNTMSTPCPSSAGSISIGSPRARSHAAVSRRFQVSTSRLHPAHSTCLLISDKQACNRRFCASLLFSGRTSSTRRFPATVIALIHAHTPGRSFAAWVGLHSFRVIFSNFLFPHRTSRISRPVRFHPVCCYQQPSARLTFAFNCPPPVSWARR